MPTASERIELERRALAGESVIDLALDYLVSVGTVRRIRYLARKRQPKDVK
jgi:predicted component of type VI protein secretion system